MVFINNAIFDLPMKEVLKGAYVRILKEHFQKMILLKELKVCPYKRCGHQVHSTYMKKKEISDLTEAMISAFPSTSGRCLSIFCKQLRHVLCYASLCFPHFCPVAAIWCLLYYTLLAVPVDYIDWEGHLNTLEKITPWLLAYDCVNYSRCVPVYLHEMREFEKAHPFALEHLRAGEFCNSATTAIRIFRNSRRSSD